MFKINLIKWILLVLFPWRTLYREQFWMIEIAVSLPAKGRFVVASISKIMSPSEAKPGHFDLLSIIKD